MPWQMDYFLDFNEGKDNIFENKIKMKNVHTFACPDYLLIGAANHAMELQNKKGYKNWITQGQIQFMFPYRLMKLDFYHQRQNIKNDDKFVVEYATQVDSPVLRNSFLHHTLSTRLDW